MSGDGRLDLDDLGEVIDHASVLDDQPRAEVLDDGNGPGWAERLEDAGITPWARRHRRPLSVAAVAVLVVVAGAIAYPRLVPPPVDPELRVRATPVVPTQNQDDTGGTVTLADQVGIFSNGQTFRAAYALTKDSADDTATYRIDGLVGPADPCEQRRAADRRPAAPRPRRSRGPTSTSSSTASTARRCRSPRAPTSST
ncbi:MAG: hypothetical protein U0S36_05995 [Candidatus Nanopelagicales bacterium]